MGVKDIPTFDTNTWYQITESRDGFASSLQLGGAGLVVAPACPDCLQNWQIIPANVEFSEPPNGSFVLRNQKTSTTQHLGVCITPTEQDSSKTTPCMLSKGNNNLKGPFTKWDITNWVIGDGYKFTNVGNGTNSYHLDVHQDNQPFLSSDTDPLPKQSAQHWMVQSVGVINDLTYSTGIPPVGMRKHNHECTLLTCAVGRSERRFLDFLIDHLSNFNFFDNAHCFALIRFVHRHCGRYRHCSERSRPARHRPRSPLVLSKE